MLCSRHTFFAWLYLVSCGALKWNFNIRWLSSRPKCTKNWHPKKLIMLWFKSCLILIYLWQYAHLKSWQHEIYYSFCSHLFKLRTSLFLVLREMWHRPWDLTQLLINIPHPSTSRTSVEDSHYHSDFPRGSFHCERFHLHPESISLQPGWKISATWKHKTSNLFMNHFWGTTCVLIDGGTSITWTQFTVRFLALHSSLSDFLR